MFLDDENTDGAVMPAADDTATEGAEETSHEETHEEAAPVTEDAGDGSEM